MFACALMLFLLLCGRISAFDRVTAPHDTHYGSVVCDGSESKITNCSLSVLNNFGHNKDAYIVCLPSTNDYTGKGCTQLVDMAQYGTKCI